MRDLLTPFRRYADFRGRSDRTEFWTFMLLVIVVEVALALVDDLLGFGRLDRSWVRYNQGVAGIADWNGGFLSLMVWLGLLIPSLAIAVRRLHDANHSGAWLMLYFVPLVGWLILLVFYTQASWPAANRWGPPPAAA